MLEEVTTGYVSQQKTLYMVQAYEQLGEISKALEILSSQETSDPTLQLMLAKLLLGKEEYTQARDVLRPLLKHKRSSRGYIPSAGEIDPAEVRWLLAEGAVKKGTDRWCQADVVEYLDLQSNFEVLKKSIYSIDKIW